MVKLSRRTAVAGMATLPLVSTRAQTVDFPDRPLRFIVGFPPAGPNDLLARVIAPGIGERRAASPAAPDTPTIAEAGLAGYEAAISYGIFLPAGAPAALVERLHDAVNATNRSSDVARRFTELGADPQLGLRPSSPPTSPTISPSGPASPRKRG